MSTKLISVVMPCYNHERYIAKAIEGILHQSHTNFELIVIDDASTDTSVKIIEEYTKDPRVIFIKNPRNLGVSHSCNIGFKKAKGEYIALQGGDDISLPSRLEKQAEYLDTHDDIGAVFSHVIAIDDDERRDTEGLEVMNTVFRQESLSREDYLLYFFIYSNFLNASSEMIRSSTLNTIGYYKISQIQLQDYDMHIRTALVAGMHIIQEPLLLYRIRNDNLNLSANNPSSGRRMFFETDSIFDNYLQIKDSGTMKKIFGNKLKNYGSITNKTIPYFLGRLAIESISLEKKLWGYKTIYNFMNADEENSALLYTTCNLKYKDFANLEEKISDIICL